MGPLKIVLTVLEVLASIALILVVLFQSGKESGIGVLSGNNDSYLNKTKSANLNKKLASATKWVALAWAVLTLVLVLI